jgi:hypothetical protein
MNTSFFFGCPADGQSMLSWNPTPQFLFFPEPPPNSLPTHLPHSTPPSRPLRRPLRVLLMGDRHDVLATIQNLHKRGFADAGEWSVPLPYPQSNPIAQFIPRPGYPVVISVHTKYMS